MKYITHLLSAGALALSFSGPAQAQNPDRPSTAERDALTEICTRLGPDFAWAGDSPNDRVVQKMCGYERNERVITCAELRGDMAMNDAEIVELNRAIRTADPGKLVVFQNVARTPDTARTYLSRLRAQHQQGSEVMSRACPQLTH